MSSNAVYETIQFQDSGRVATVCLNRPDVRNAFHPTMIKELTEVFEGLSVRTDLSVVILKGAGKSFCSGADLGYMKSMAAFSFDENVSDSQQLFGMFWAIRNCPLPVVGSLHGHAMGGALGLAAVCDIAAAVDGTQFCFSEVKLGLAPAVISPFVLEKMSPGSGRRFMLTGEVFGPEEALHSGLIQFKGSEEAVESFVEKTVKALTQNGPEAVRATKRLLREIESTSTWDEKRVLTTTTIAERRVSNEGQEGLRAFFEKRQPSWKPVE